MEVDAREARKLRGALMAIQAMEEREARKLVRQKRRDRAPYIRVTNKRIPSTESSEPSEPSEPGGACVGEMRMSTLRHRTTKRTTVPEHTLPSILEAAMERVREAQPHLPLDMGKVQSLVIEAAFSHAHLTSDKRTADALVERISRDILFDPQLFAIRRHPKGIVGCLDEREHKQRIQEPSETSTPRTSWSVSKGEDTQRVLARYDQVMETDEMVHRRVYREEHVWTPDEEKRFEEAFLEYGDSSGSNRKIAQFIGNGVFPQHVIKFKRTYKQKIKDLGIPAGTLFGNRPRIDDPVTTEQEDRDTIQQPPVLSSSM